MYTKGTEMSRYLSLKQAVSEFRVTAKRLVSETGEGEFFPLCQWAGTQYYSADDLEIKFRWRKSRSQRAREVSYALVKFQSATRH